MCVRVQSSRHSNETHPWALCSHFVCPALNGNYPPAEESTFEWSAEYFPCPRIATTLPANIDGLLQVGRVLLTYGRHRLDTLRQLAAADGSR